MRSIMYTIRKCDAAQDRTKNIDCHRMHGRAALTLTGGLAMTAQSRPMRNGSRLAPAGTARTNARSGFSGISVLVLLLAQTAVPPLGAQGQLPELPPPAAIK